MAGVRRAAAAGCRRRECRAPGHAQADGSTAGGELAHGFQFLRRGGQGGLDRGDFAEPALLPGLLEAIEEIGVDLLEPWSLSWVNAEEGAPDAPLTDLTSMSRQVAACFRRRVASLSA